MEPRKRLGEILLEKGGFDPGILVPLRMLAEKSGEKSAAHLITDGMVESFYVLGNPARCRERVHGDIRTLVSPGNQSSRGINYSPCDENP